MKIILVMMINFIVQDISNPQDFIGKKVDSAFVEKNQMINVEENEDETLYSINNVNFLNNSCRTFFIRTNSKKIITKVFFGFNHRIDNDFYKSMTEKYGEHQRMFKMQNPIEKNHGIGQNYSFTALKGIAIDCSFNENPMFILWSCDGFKISITLTPEQESTLITFDSSLK